MIMKASKTARKQAVYVLAAFAALCAAFSLHAAYDVADKGMWPTNWPKELEALRKQSRSLDGDYQSIYEIAFTNRLQFEAAWPHILAVKSPEAPIILLNGPNGSLGTIKAGVRMLAPLTGKSISPEGTRYPPSAEGIVTNVNLLRIGPPWPDNVKSKSGVLPEFVGYDNGRWVPYSVTNRKTNDLVYERSIMRARTDLELIMDGDVVDLNRIRLPADTPIIDRRVQVKGSVEPRAVEQANEAAAGPGEREDTPPIAVTNLIPWKLGSSIPLAVQSAGVAWRGDTYHLVRLGSITFDLDKNACLKADIQAGVTEFDNIDYDISGAVFDAAGQLLGSARAQCKVQRMWAGEVEVSAQTIRLDFGVSLDYTRAASFMVSVSNRKVLTPDEWEKNFMLHGFKVGIRPGIYWPVAANVYVPAARLEDSKQASAKLQPIIAARLAGLEKDDITQRDRCARVEDEILADARSRLPELSVQKVLLSLDVK